MYQNLLSEYKNSITHWYQPIYYLENNNIFGYEALLRDSSHSQISPFEIFREADKKRQRNILDLISIQTAIDVFNDESNTLFLNVYSSTLLIKGFLQWWDNHISPQIPVVLELSENESVMNWKELKRVIRGLNYRGVKIAVDNMGSGYSSIKQFIELSPGFIKLDRYFAEELSTNIIKQKVLRNLATLVSDTTEIIIEGIEKEEDLKAAKLLGITYAQGYLLRRPSPREKCFIKY